MQLPVGVYAVSQCFDGTEGAVEFTFQGVSYEAQVGTNAFPHLENLCDVALQAVQSSFCGYENMPVVLMPAGLYKAGTIRETRFRTYLPCAMAILGENAGLSPNGPDLRSEGQRREETVIKGSFYFGCIALRDPVEGTLILDGLSLETLKVFDERTEAKDAGLTLRNCRFTSFQNYDLIRAAQLTDGTRNTLLEDCRADGIDACFNDGRLLGIACGDVTVERLYFANTDKFPGFTNYSRSIENRLGKVAFRDCIFENCGSVHGMSIQLPEDSTAQLELHRCEFLNFAPREDSALWVRLPATAALRVKACRFAGQHDAPAIRIDGAMDAVTLADTVQEGYEDLCCFSPARRTVVGMSAEPLADPHTPISADAALEQLYGNKSPRYCDFHCHSNSGGTSDGKTPLENYIAGMDALGVDCVAIVDHRQMRHYFLPAWDDRRMICGSEPSARLEGRGSSFDYTMIFPDKTGLAQVMGAFPEFQFTGTWDGHFGYPKFTPERFLELGEYIYSIGGLLSHAHPMQLPGTGNPGDYFFSEYMAFETVHGDVNAFSTRQNHNLWVKILGLGKRLRTHGSSDSHGPVSNRGLTTVYTEENFSTDIFNTIRSGNCVAGGVGIQMCIGETPMGSSVPFAEGLRLSVRVADFHAAHWQPDTVYALKVYTEKGLAYAVEFDGTKPVTLTLPVQQRLFYRCEVVNESDGLPVAYSNPIWLD